LRGHSHQIFTYGALYRAILALFPSLQGFSLGSVYSSYLRIEFCIAVLLTYAMASVLLRRQPPWTRAFYILLMAIFWWPGNSKSVLSVSVFTMITFWFRGYVTRWLVSSGRRELLRSWLRQFRSPASGCGSTRWIGFP
jgi:hypothetical protein